MFDLTILSPEKEIFQGKARSLKASGVDGHFEVLANHAPMIAMLKSGKILVDPGDGIQKVFEISDGVFEISDNRARILVDQL